MPPKDKEEYEFFRIEFPYWDLIRILRMLKNFEAEHINVYYEDDKWKMTFYVKKPSGVLICGDSEVEKNERWNRM